MEKIVIRERPAIVCPISKKWQLLDACEKCDGYKGFHNQLAKDGKIPTAVKCAQDEF